MIAPGKARFGSQTFTLSFLVSSELASSALLSGKSPRLLSASGLVQLRFGLETKIWRQIFERPEHRSLGTLPDVSAPAAGSEVCHCAGDRCPHFPWLQEQGYGLRWNCTNLGVHERLYIREVSYSKAFNASHFMFPKKWNTNRARNSFASYSGNFPWDQG